MDEILNVKVIKMFRMEGDSKIKAYCDLVFGELFMVRGFKVIDGDQGLFVSWPQRNSAQGKRYNVFSPATTEIAEYLKEIILEAYQGEDKPE